MIEVLEDEERYIVITLEYTETAFKDLRSLRLIVSPSFTDF